MLSYKTSETRWRRFVPDVFHIILVRAATVLHGHHALCSGIICTLLGFTHAPQTRSSTFYTNPCKLNEHIFLAWVVHRVDLKQYSKRFASVYLGSAHLTPDSEVRLDLPNSVVPR